MLRCLGLIFVLSACAGSDPAASTPVVPERWIVHDILQVGWAVPADWIEKPATTGLVLSGPEDAPSYYTTLSLQVVQPGLDATFDEILAAAYDNHVLEAVSFAPALVTAAGDALARWYRVDFVAFDDARRRVGVLVDDPPYVIDLSYVAPVEAFASEIGVFERALQTFYREPCCGR